jgi:hypothetical protein
VDDPFEMPIPVLCSLPCKGNDAYCAKLGQMLSSSKRKDVDDWNKRREVF